MAGVEGRVALVTGAGRGIGRETALLLPACGARVMAVARSENELVALGLDFVAADLGTREGCEQAVAEVARRLGPVDILVFPRNRAPPRPGLKGERARPGPAPSAWSSPSSGPSAPRRSWSGSSSGWPGRSG